MNLAALSPLALALLALPGCGGGGGDCADGVDNDGDGLVDSADPGCELNGDLESPDPDLPECSDLQDNDGDGLTDLDDPGCDSPDDDDERNNPIPRCRNGIDDDEDGLLDFPNDPGCSISLDDDESDDCPSGTTCPACSNGEDDDGDGDVDYPDDLGCSSSGDRDEENADPTICGPNVPLHDLPPDGVAMGAAVDGDLNDLISMECGGNGPETAYRFTLDQESALLVTTDFEETNVDTVLYVRSDCREPETEVGCNDDSDNGLSAHMVIERLEPGEYFVIVDSQGGFPGDYKLEVASYTPVGDPCDPDAADPECAPGYDCRLADEAATGETCVESITGPSCEENGILRAVNVPAPGDLVISEYMADPNEVDDAVGEWFEVRVEADVDINGLEAVRTFSWGDPTGTPLTIDSTECLPVTTGDHLLFARSDVTADNGGLPAVDPKFVFSFDLVNTSGGVEISTGGVEISEATWSSFSSPIVTGVAASLDPTGSPWCEAVDTYGDGMDKGTPGTANPSCP